MESEMAADLKLWLQGLLAYIDKVPKYTSIPSVHSSMSTIIRVCETECTSLINLLTAEAGHLTTNMDSSLVCLNMKSEILSDLPHEIGENPVKDEDPTEIGNFEIKAQTTVKSEPVMAADKEMCVDEVDYTGVDAQDILGGNEEEEESFESQLLSNPCSLCNLKFPTLAALKRHKKEEHKPQKKSFICPICSKNCFSSYRLERHKRSHNGLKPYVCEHCGNCYQQENDLKRHMKKHSGAPPSGPVCPVEACGRRLASQNALNTHMRIHSNEKPYVCPTCGKAFRTSSVARRHNLVHITERNHICSFCSKAFKCAAYLNDHLNKIHAREELLDLDEEPRSPRNSVPITVTISLPLSELTHPLPPHIQVLSRAEDVDQPSSQKPSSTVDNASKKDDFFDEMLLHSAGMSSDTTLLSSAAVSSAATATASLSGATTGNEEGVHEQKEEMRVARLPDEFKVNPNVMVEEEEEEFHDEESAIDPKLLSKTDSLLKTLQIFRTDSTDS